jgi:hypothetical protein
VGVTPVFSDDDVRAKALGFRVFLKVIGDIVESVLQTSKLRVYAVRGKDPLVERGQDGIAHAITPAEVSQLPRRVSRAPLPAGGGQLSCGGHACQMNFHGGRFWEHAKAKDAIGAASCREHEPELARDPRDGKGNAPARAEVEHPRTVAAWGRGPKRLGQSTRLGSGPQTTSLKQPFGGGTPNDNLTGC